MGYLTVFHCSVSSLFNTTCLRCFFGWMLLANMPILTDFEIVKMHYILYQHVHCDGSPLLGIEVVRGKLVFLLFSMCPENDDSHLLLEGRQMKF